MNLGEIIKEYRTANNMTMNEFAKRANLTKGYISMIERNLNPKTKRNIIPSYSTLKLVANAMSLDVNEIISMLDGEQPIRVSDNKNNNVLQEKSIKIFSSVKLDKNNNEIIDVTDETLTIPSQFIKGSLDEYFLLRASGNSMHPQIVDGDLILIYRTNQVSNGDIALIQINDKDSVIRKVEYNETNQQMKLIPANPEYVILQLDDIETAKCRILGKIVTLFRNY